MCRNANAGAADIRQHSHGCECWRCELRLAFRKLQKHFAGAAMDAVREGNRAAAEDFIAVSQEIRQRQELLRYVRQEDAEVVMYRLLTPRNKAA